MLNSQNCKFTEIKTDHSVPKKKKNLSDDKLHIYLYVNAASAGTRPTVEIKTELVGKMIKFTSLCSQT